MVTIYPDNPGDVVSVAFTSFSTEAGWDALYVFNGNPTSAPQLASGNGPGNVPGGLAGGYWGTTIPGPFMSSSADGSLTFWFRSDSNANASGWTANVTCGPPPVAGCSKPTNLSVTTTASGTTMSWIDPNPNAGQWEYLLVPGGSAIPLETAAGTVIDSNPYNFSDLDENTFYTVYLRTVCPAGGKSFWTAGYDFSSIAEPVNDNCMNAIDAPVNPFNG